MDGYAACMGPREPEEGGKSAGGCFFDDGEGRGGIVDMDVSVEDGEDEFGSYAGGVGGGVELGHEALVPGVDGVLEDLFDVVEEAILADAGLRKLGIEELGEFLRFVVFD